MARLVQVGASGPDGAAAYFAVVTPAGLGLYWFVFAEVIKVMLAAAVSTGWQYTRKERP